MEDRYLFKAKHIHILPGNDHLDGSWVVGFLSGERYIANDSGEYLIDPSTTCQCTGLKDKNGKLIWENDVVRFKHEKFDFDYGLEPLKRNCLPRKKEYTRNYAVEFCNVSTCYGLRFRNKSIWFMVHRMTIVMHDTEIIGNIFDNPELLESEG